MLKKNYQNIVRMEDPKEGLLVIGMEGAEHVDVSLNDGFPQTQIIPKRRRFITALLQSLRYSKMGILNSFIRMEKK